MSKKRFIIQHFPYQKTKLTFLYNRLSIFCSTCSRELRRLYSLSVKLVNSWSMYKYYGIFVLIMLII